MTARTARICVGLFLALLVGYWLGNAPNIGGDTAPLVAGARVVVHCLGHGPLTRCGKEDLRPGGPLDAVAHTSVGPWPLLQYVIAVPLAAAGVSSESMLKVLSLTSLLAFVALLALLWAVAGNKAGAEWSPTLVLAAITGPLIFYGFSTFGEMLSALLLTAVVAAGASGRRAWVLAVAALLAGVTKETAPPFVVALGAVAVLAADGSADRRRRLAALAGGSIAAVILNSAFNVFRYGSVINADYSQSLRQVHGIKHLADFFAALLISPQGGIAWFWPAAVAILAAAAISGLRARRAGARWWPAAAIVAIFMVVIAGLSNWWSPFGWAAWGPRLTVPWIPPLLLLAVATCGRNMTPALGRLTAGTKSRIAAVAAATAFVLPQLGVLLDPSTGFSIFASTKRCPYTLPSGDPRYYPCIDHKIWSGHVALIGAIGGDGSGQGAVFVIAYAAAAFGLLSLARSELAEPG